MMITEATSEHIPQLLDLVNIAYRSKTNQGWTSEADLVSGDRIHTYHLNEILSDPSSKIFIIFQASQLVACVHINISNQSCYIGMLTTHPDVQNQGIGKIMLDYAEKFALNHYAITSFTLSVLSARTELINYYKRRGYEMTNIVDAYPHNANVGIPKSDTLTVLHLIKHIHSQSA
ncbi:MAG: GNAT family N-acetyltransferase [Acinetobacter sp.]